MIRNVLPSDAIRIAEIYNYYIEHTIITFEEELITENDIKQRIEKMLHSGFPYIVYQENDKILGYAYLNNWRTRSAYDITLETSVYVDQEIIGKGIGRKLYAELIKEAKKMNLHSLVAGISLPNVPSQRLHEKFDFKLVGNFKEVGQKFNTLIDVEFWQLML